MQIGLGIGTTFRQRWNPLLTEQIRSLLFSASERGAWYDPSDMSTLFQDSAGTTPVTALEQPVGRMLDKSGRGNHATQSTTTKRPIYSRRVNLLLATATHYMSSGYIFDDFAALLPLTTVEPSTEDGEPYTVTERPGNVPVVEGLAAQAGITLPPGAIAALFDAIEVTELGPWEAMEWLGLRIAQPEVALSLLEK